MEDTGERLIPEGHTQTLTYGEHLARYQSVIPLVKGKKVLDVASGTGYGSQLIAQYADVVDGLDYSEQAVKYAQEHFPAKNLTYAQGDAQAMPYDDKSFDVVVSLETIEHLPQPEKFVSEVKRILKPDGVFVVSTPNDAEFMDGNEFHVHEFQFPELERLIAENFSHSQYYFQGTYFAAGIFKKESFTGSYGMKSIPVSATFGETTDKAIYFIAVAANSAYASLAIDENIVIADRWSTKDDLERDSARQQSTASLENRLKDLQRHSDGLAAELAEIKQSKSWQAVTKLRSMKHGVFKGERHK